MMPISPPSIRQCLLGAALVALLLSGCSSARFPGVYRIDIPQGNFITESMLEQLEPGMTAEQVRYVLGHPTLVDPFTPNTWYYPMIYQPGRGETVEQRIVVYFVNGQYAYHEGEVIEDFRNRTSGQLDRELARRVREQQKAAERQAEAAENAPTRRPVIAPSEQPEASTTPGVPTL